MKLVGLKKVYDGKYLRNYVLTYLNKANQEKHYEIVSRSGIDSIEQLGQKTSGVSMVVTMHGKMLLLKEFRMGINKSIYNLCAGMIEHGETMEECIARELYEETGLKVKEIKAILPSSYSAVAISDIKTNIAFVEAQGEIADHSSHNEEISAAFYSKDEIKEMLKTKEFSSRSQLAAYFFANAIDFEVDK